MSAIAVELLIIIILVLANGVLAMSEMALVSARKPRLHQRASRGDARAQAALLLAEAPGRFLSTVQIGITLVGILAGAFGGATIAEQLAHRLRVIVVLAPYSDAIGLGIVVLIITYLSLVIGELVPKRLALNHPEQIARAVARPMRRLSAIAAPAVHLLSASTDLVLRILRTGPSAEPPVTQEEIKALIEQGTQAGVFSMHEQEIVKSVFRLGDRRINALMTPRRTIVWLDLNASIEDIQRTIAESIHTRFPVSRGSLDHIVGVVHAKDLLVRCLAGLPVTVEAVLQRPLLVPENLPALQVVELFKSSPTHLALVIDEHGSIQGLVTLNDILESIVGDLPTLDEPVEPSVVQREDGSWLLDGMLPVDELKELFRLHRLPEEERSRYQTLGGFVITYLGHIPSVTDQFEWGGFRFEVVDMDGHRVDKVLVRPIAAPLAEDA